ncbi:hypothetical protein [Xenorhabdus bovienii]
MASNVRYNIPSVIPVYTGNVIYRSIKAKTTTVYPRRNGEQLLG